MVKYLILAIIYVGAIVSFKVASQDVEEHPLIADIKPETFKVLGTAKFSMLFWDIYESKLMTTTGDFPVDTNQEKVLFEIHYLRDISAKELIERTIEQWQHIGVEESDYQRYIPELKRIWPDISNDDKLSLLIEDARSRFYFNQEHIGDIEQSEFGQLFIDIWLSPKTSQPKLRRQLLGEFKK